MTIFPTTTKGKSIGVSKIPSSISFRLSKEILAKLKFSKNINNYKKILCLGFKKQYEKCYLHQGHLPKTTNQESH